jgi:hypothetical protein
MAAGQDKTGKDHQGALARAWVWLDSAHDVIFSDRNRAALKQLAIRLSVAGFLVHLLLIFLARTLPHPPPIIAEAGGNYLAAISTPFNFILFYEVLTLIAALPASTTRSIASQFEIVSLIFIRDVFRDIAKASDLVTIHKLTLESLPMFLDMWAGFAMFLLVAVFLRPGGSIAGDAALYFAKANDCSGIGDSAAGNGSIQPEHLFNGRGPHADDRARRAGGDNNLL